MVITILSKGRRKVDVRLLRARARRLLVRLRMPPGAHLNILLESDDGLKRLHRRYFGLNTRTNVISFGQWRGGVRSIRSHVKSWPRKAPFPLGDIAISIDRAGAEADAAGMGLNTRLTQLLIHGLLHILGHEHERGGSKARAMERAEAILFDELTAGGGTHV